MPSSALQSSEVSPIDVWFIWCLHMLWLLKPSVLLSSYRQSRRCGASAVHFSQFTYDASNLPSFSCCLWPQLLPLPSQLHLLLGMIVFLSNSFIEWWRARRKPVQVCQNTHLRYSWKQNKCALSADFTRLWKQFSPLWQKSSTLSNRQFLVCLSLRIITNVAMHSLFTCTCAQSWSSYFGLLNCVWVYAFAILG